MLSGEQQSRRRNRGRLHSQDGVPEPNRMRVDGNLVRGETAFRADRQCQRRWNRNIGEGAGSRNRNEQRAVEIFPRFVLSHFEQVGTAALFQACDRPGSDLLRLARVVRTEIRLQPDQPPRSELGEFLDDESLANCGSRSGNRHGQIRG